MFQWGLAFAFSLTSRHVHCGLHFRSVRILRHAFANFAMETGELEQRVRDDDSVHHGRPHVDEEVQEVPVVEVPDAVGHPGAVMIHVQDEGLRHAVVVRTRRLGTVAPEAERPVVRPDDLRGEGVSERGGGVWDVCTEESSASAFHKEVSAVRSRHT